MMSSSPAPAPSSGSSRPRKPPSVTPNTFRRFFTPRPYPRISSNRLLFGRRPLRDITRRANNRNGAARAQGSSAVDPFPDIGSNQSQDVSSTTVGSGGGGSGGHRTKRRKTSHTPGYGLRTPPVSATQTPTRTATTDDTHNTQDSPSANQDTTLQHLSDQESDDMPAISEIARYNEQARSVRLLQRELGDEWNNFMPAVETPGKS